MFTLFKLHVFRIFFFVLASLAAQKSFAQIFIHFSYWQNLECVPDKYIYTFAVSGTYNVSVPCRSNRMTVYMWGAGGGGGACNGVGASFQNGTGVNPYSTVTPATMPGANATGGTGNADNTICNTGTDGYAYIYFYKL